MARGAFVTIVTGATTIGIIATGTTATIDGL